jgi:hypothetical protein
LFRHRYDLWSCKFNRLRDLAARLVILWDDLIGFSKMNPLPPETIELLQNVLDETWESLRPEERSRTSEEQIAIRLLDKARAGEKNPFRLRIAAIDGIVTFPL